jgi:hypothetical protein
MQVRLIGEGKRSIAVDLCVLDQGGRTMDALSIPAWSLKSSALLVCAAPCDGSGPEIPLIPRIAKHGVEKDGRIIVQRGGRIRMTAEDEGGLIEFAPGAHEVKLCIVDAVKGERRVLQCQRVDIAAKPGIDALRRDIGLLRDEVAGQNIFVKAQLKRMEAQGSQDTEEMRAKLRGIAEELDALGLRLSSRTEIADADELFRAERECSKDFERLKRGAHESEFGGKPGEDDIPE